MNERWTIGLAEGGRKKGSRAVPKKGGGGGGLKTGFFELGQASKKGWVQLVNLGCGKEGTGVLRIAHGESKREEKERPPGLRGGKKLFFCLTGRGGHGGNRLEIGKNCKVPKRWGEKVGLKSKKRRPISLKWFARQ